MSKWEEIRIKDIGQVITGNTPPRKEPELLGDSYPFIKPTDMVIDQRYTFKTEEFYSEEGYKRYRRSLIPKGATCVVTIGSIGQKMTLAKEDCFINQAVNAVIPNEERFDQMFVYYLLKYNLYQVKSADSGTSSGRENVSKSAFSNIKILAPPLLVQRQIAGILSAYDDLIENNFWRIRLLEESARLEYQLMMQQKDETWEVKRLGELTSFLKRGISPAYVETDGIVVLNQKCVRDHFINYEPARMTSLEKKVPNERMLQPWDIIINSTGAGTLGRIAQYISSELDCTVDSHITIVRANREVSPAFLASALITQENAIEAMGEGATLQTELSATRLANEVNIVLPPIEVREEYEQIAKAKMLLCHNLFQQNTRLKAARDLLLPRLMSGELAAPEEVTLEAVE